MSAVPEARTPHGPRVDTVPPRAGTAGGATRPARGPVVPAWFLLIFVIVIAVHVLAGLTTIQTIELMRSMSPFAQDVRAFDLRVLEYWRPMAYAIAISIVLSYLWPVLRHLRDPGQPPSPTVQRRAISAPFVIAMTSFLPWCCSVVLFPLLAIWRFGRWDTSLMSQHVLSPLVNGFLAATATYLVLEWLFRSQVVPRVFATGRIPQETGACLSAGVRTRFLLFLGAVAFIPLFTMLGLVRSTAVRLETQAEDPRALVAALAHASTTSFLLFVALGVVLTLVLARSLTRPLRDVVAALRRVQRGDLEVRVQVGSSDEVGVLEDGVNAMVTALRDKERIFQTFGRVVEPSVRDHLLAGASGVGGGEVRAATVLFCDLRNFTAMAERLPPAEVVATLNEFFGVMTAWVRRCGGFVDKFIGDAMLVVFGLFDGAEAARGPAGAAEAVRCALGMRERLAELNVARAAEGREPLAMTIAVHAGEVLAGTIGAADRHEFTVIGDTVNIAARLQQLCKEQGSDLLLTGAAYQLAREGGLADVLVERDAVALRGRSAPITVYAPA